MAIPEDPLAWMESLDERTVSWALEQSARCEKLLSDTSSRLLPLVSQYMQEPYILDLKASDAGLFYLRRTRDHEIVHNGRVIVASEDLEKGSVIHRFYVDRKGERLAYFYSKGGDEGALNVVDVMSGKSLAKINGKIGDVLFTESGFYYVRLFSDTPTPDGVSPPAERVFRGNQIVWGEGLSTGLMISLNAALSSQRAFAHVRRGWTETALYAGPPDNPAAWKLLVKSDVPLQALDCVPGGDVVLKYRGSGEILVGDKVVVVGKDTILDAAVVRNSLLVVHSRDASCYLVRYSFEGKSCSTFAPKQPSTISLLTSNGTAAFFKLESFGTPYALYRFGENYTLLEHTEALTPRIAQGFVSSKDGTRVHYFEVGDRTRRVLVYGYGGFNISLTPWFSTLFATLLQKGVSVVVANLRGGSEYGESWHIEGKGLKKQNVFDDFAAVISHFRGKGCRVVAMGRSNGGLLVGATLVQHPELLDGVVIGYPVLDMLRFHLLHVGKLWTEEYGDPDNPADRIYLRAYSPYHNLFPKAYPPIMIYTGLNDDRVHPAHAFKFAKKLEALGIPFCLRVARESGHMGVSPDGLIKEISDICSFVLSCLGEEPPNVGFS